MDPLSVTASIIAIVQITGQCLTLARIGPTKYNQEKLKEINTILNGFNDTVTKLQAHLTRKKDDQSRLVTLDHLKVPLMRCEEALKLLTSRMQGVGFCGRYVLGSRFDKKLDDCLRVLKKATGLLGLALQCDQMYVHQGDSYATKRHSANARAGSWSMPLKSTSAAFLRRLGPSRLP
jgi:hypothetical protein